MSEGQYRILGWFFLVGSIALSLLWCIKQSGPAGWMMSMSEKYLSVRLVQFSCLFTFVLFVLPAYILKRYMDALAWNAHVEKLPPPDVQESARRSKYIQVDPAAAPVVPKPVNTAALPKDQEEFIATCTACGNLFSARRETKRTQCPNCGEILKL